MPRRAPRHDGRHVHRTRETVRLLAAKGVSRRHACGDPDVACLSLRSRQALRADKRDAAHDAEAACRPEPAGQPPRPRRIWRLLEVPMAAHARHRSAIHRHGLASEARGESVTAGRRRLPRPSSEIPPPRSPNHRSLASLLLIGGLAIAARMPQPAAAWDHWGGDNGGTRYSPLRQIAPANVGALVRAWQYSTGDLRRRDPAAMARTMFEATPLFVEESLIFCSPFNEVIALEPGTGEQKWRFDPKINTTQRPANRYNCRGVTHWVDSQAPAGAACRSRIFTGTNDVACAGPGTRSCTRASRPAMPMSGRRCRATRN
jgi:hypothetical protein